MKELKLDYIAAGTQGKIFAKANGDEFASVNSVAIDSRQTGEGCLFFSIIGARSDAHNFLEDVRIRGCHNIVVSDEAWAAKMKAHGDMNVILVKDTTMALVNLATRYMDDWKGLTRVAITGSVGKTSTKEFMYSILSSKYATGKTKGNLNSEYGIPLTCFDYDTDIEMAVVEIGLGYGLEMEHLVNIVKPQAAIVTTVGSSHLEVYGSKEKLLEAKLAITTGLTQEGVLVVNSDNPLLSVESVKEHTKVDFRLATVGTGDDCNIKLTDICDKGIEGVQCTLKNFVDGELREYKLELPVIGAHNLWNAAEAIAVGLRFGIDPQDAIDALKHVQTNDNRLDIHRTDKYVVINDTYNASPESMKAGIDIVMHSEAKRRGMILGDMFELGDNSESLHEGVGEYAAEKGIDFLVTVGDLSKAIARGARKNSSMQVFSFDDKLEAGKELLSFLEEGDVVLVKGSRAMELEKLVEVIA